MWREARTDTYTVTLINLGYAVYSTHHTELRPSLAQHTANTALTYSHPTATAHGRDGIGCVGVIDVTFSLKTIS